MTPLQIQVMVFKSLQQHWLRHVNEASSEVVSSLWSPVPFSENPVEAWPFLGGLWVFEIVENFTSTHVGPPGWWRDGLLFIIWWICLASITDLWSIDLSVSIWLSCELHLQTIKSLNGGVGVRVLRYKTLWGAPTYLKTLEWVIEKLNECSCWQRWVGSCTDVRKIVPAYWVEYLYNVFSNVVP